MGVDQNYIDWVMDLLEPVGNVTNKAMFGGHGIFEDQIMFALVSKEPALYFKVDDSNREIYEKAGSLRYRPMPYFSVPADILEDQDQLHDWAKKSIEVARATSKSKRK